MQFDGIEVEVEGDQIIVTVPSTAFRAVFYRSEDPSALTQSPAVSVDKEAPSYVHRDFEQAAWEAATAKARELGWIRLKPGDANLGGPVEIPAPFPRSLAHS